MILFMHMPKLPEMTEAFLDSTLLSILVSPALYYFLYKPLKIENKERRLVEQELRKSERQLMLKAQQLEEYNQSLETKVLERTQEINEQNIRLKEILKRLHSTQAQMVQSEKMSSLGQLVAGVAHEINNPVNFIYGNLVHIRDYTQNLLSFVKLYQKYYPRPVSEISRAAADLDLDFLYEDLPKLVQSMQMGADRICEIVLSLRNFSRLDESEFKAVDIHQGIDSTLVILRHRLKAEPGRPEIQVILDYGDLPLIECCPGLLNQVLMNLLTNAIDALEEVDTKQTHQAFNDRSRQISISTSIINSQISHSQWVKISITDNAFGIPEAIRKQIFNPFFTTKPIGKGTGMGMAISYQIITEKHQGTLECFSNVGEGTTFEIKIPAHHSVPRDSVPREI